MYQDNRLHNFHYFVRSFQIKRNQCSGERHRTTNLIESWHHRMNDHFNAKPNWYNILDFFRLEERRVFVKNLNHEAQTLASKRRRQAIEKDDRLMDLIV